MMEGEIGKSSTSKSDVEKWEDEWRLVPRIRLEFSMVKVGDSGVDMPLAGSGYGYGYGFSASGCDWVIEDLCSEVPRLYDDNRAVKLPRSDIHVDDVVPPRYDPYYDEHDPFSEPRSEIGRGSLFIRDLNFVFGDGNGDVVDYKFHGKLSKARRFLIDKLRPFTLSYPKRRTKFQFWAFVPVSEDPDLMNGVLAHLSSEFMQPHPIVVRGLPCSWFAQPGSSQPSDHLLRLFFQKFGQLRNLDTSVDDRKATCCNVEVLYENYHGCYNALLKLCSFSLQKRGDSEMTVDYEVDWKDYKPVEKVNWPFNEERGLPEQFALERRMSEIKKELKLVKKKIDDLVAYKNSRSYSSKKRKKDYSSYHSRKSKASHHSSKKRKKDYSSYYDSRKSKASHCYPSKRRDSSYH